MNKKRLLILLSIFFILLTLTIFFLLEFEKEDKINKYINSQKKEYVISYNSIYHQYKQRSQLIFDTKINKSEILEVFKDASEASELEKQKLRDELYHILKDDYKVLKDFFVKQLQFHLPNNSSFLRFNKPEKYGDDLTSLRPTVKYVNENKKFVESFEQGVTFDGYRFVYPLFFENRYIGSVEVSFDSKAILSEFTDHFNVPVKFLIFSEKLDKSFDSIIQRSKLGNSFAKYEEKTKKLYIGLPLKNQVTKEVVGSVLIDIDSGFIQNKKVDFYIIFAVLVFLLAVIFIVIYFELKTKEKLQENSKKLQAVFEEADSGIALMDLDGNFLEVNHVYTQLLGYSSEEFKKLNCVDLTKEEFKSISDGALSEAKITGSVSKVRKTCISKDGLEVPLEMSLNLLPNKKSFVAIVNSLEDKIELENLLNRFEHIFKFTSVGFLILNDKREVIEVNPKFLKMIGFNSKDEIIGKSTRVFHVDEEHFKNYGELIYSKTLLNENVRIEYEFKKKDGSRVWFELSGSPLNDNAKLQDGSILWAVVDVTDKVFAQNKIKEQNEQLQSLNKNLNDEVKSQIEKIREKDMILIQQSKMASMGEMMDAVAHQWKQPLVIIKLSTDEIGYMIEDKAVDIKYLNSINERVRTQIDHMVETLNEFRQFFRPKGELKSISLKKIIDSALVLMKDELVKYTIVTKFVGDESVKVKVIPNEFKHIIINLVNNAKDEFVNKDIKNRTITFDVTKEDLFVVLKVQDTAGGIPSSIIDDIFKANVTTKGEGKGTGIGLYMTKNIIQKIGGSIDVSNIKNGAEFTIRIPI